MNSFYFLDNSRVVELTLFLKIQRYIHERSDGGTGGYLLIGAETMI